MFERFTDRARKVLAFANGEARSREHQRINSGHVLLGFLKEGSGVGFWALTQLGGEKERLSAVIDPLLVEFEQAGLNDGGLAGRVLGRFKKQVRPDRLPQTVDAKHVLKHAVEEARGLNHNYVGTEHLLLGMLHLNRSIAGKALASCGVRLDAARKTICDMFGVEIAEEDCAAYFCDGAGI